jgi:DNA invertase Pin-like site-specific DNA recombinase
MRAQAFGYTRVSGQGQVDGHGLERQHEAIQSYSQAHQLDLVDVFREEGVSGTLEDRPALADLMLSLEQNGHGVKAVIIERLDRLARDLMVQEAIVRDFQSKGYQLISTTEGPDLCKGDPTRKLIRQIFGAVAEYDKSMLVMKLKAARQRKRAKTGRCEGRKPYGWTPEEQHVLRRIRAMRRRNKLGRPSMAWAAIADRLNGECVPTKAGGLWAAAKVHSIMKVR